MSYRKQRNDRKEGGSIYGVPFGAVKACEKERKEISMEYTFTLTNPIAADIARIVQRNQDNEKVLHKLLIYAKELEKALASK